MGREGLVKGHKGRDVRGWDGKWYVAGGGGGW